MKKLLKHFPILALIILTACAETVDSVNPIVGKWEHYRDKSYYFEFSEDGTYDIKDSRTNNSVFLSQNRYSTYEYKGKKRIKFTVIVNGEVVNTRHVVYKLDKDVLRFQTRAYSHRGSKSWFESYYRKK